MFLIVNPAAAGGRVGKQWPAFLERLRRVGLDLPTTFTNAPGHATELAAQAVRDGHDVVAAAGGDGTICEVIQGLQASGRGALAIIPVGTGNDAARTLGMPLDLEAAAAAILRGRTRRIDLIQVGDEVVFNAVGIGLLGDINLRAADIKVVRGLASYLAAATASLLHFGGPRVTIEAGDFRYQGTMMILAVHCGPTTGGGFRLAPAARPDDGILDACLVEDMGVLRRLHRLVAALRGTLGEQLGSHPFTFERLELATEVALPGHLDGNPFVVEPPGTTIQVLPGAQEVIVP